MRLHFCLAYFWLVIYLGWKHFAAIRFVLSDLFQNLRNEDRHALLHVTITLLL